jgi:hypothetical protein
VTAERRRVGRVIARVALLVVVSLGFGLALGVAKEAQVQPAEAAVTPPTRCGSISTRYLYAVTAHRVTCLRARTIAVQWANQCAQIPTGSCLVTAGFYCRFRSTGHESGAIRCIAEADLLRAHPRPRLVSFVTGV